jgi:hypothetical protein
LTLTIAEAGVAAAAAATFASSGGGSTSTSRNECQGTARTTALAVSETSRTMTAGDGVARSRAGEVTWTAPPRRTIYARDGVTYS